MPKRERAPGFGDRLTRVQERLGIESGAEMARRLGVRQQRYHTWLAQDGQPATITLKQAVKRLGVWGWKDLLSWLADGEDAPPAWLDDPALDPFAPAASSPEPTPTGPGGLRPAMPSEVLNALEELRTARDASGLRDPHVMRAYLALEDALTRLAGTSSSRKRVA